MSSIGYLSERTQPFLMANLVAGTSVVATGSTVVDLQGYNADSVYIVACVTNTTGTGFTMTAQGGASTTAFGGYCTTAGSTASLLTAATTTSGQFVTIDIKKAPHRYVRVSYAGLGAINGAIIGFPYDTKKQPLAAASTSLIHAVVKSVSPTTA